MHYEKQLLCEYETKLDAVQNRLDWMLFECFTEIEMQPYQEEWDRLMDIVNDIKKRLGRK